MSMSDDVLKFVLACDQMPSEENCFLYQQLISEEFREFCLAYVENDEVEMLDACMDMIWVILGFCHMKGYDVNGAWSEVSRSNFEKIDSTTGKVRKREDGKVLKPEGWTPPNLTSFVGK